MHTEHKRWQKRDLRNSDKMFVLLFVLLQIEKHSDRAKKYIQEYQDNERVRQKLAADVQVGVGQTLSPVKREAADERQRQEPTKSRWRKSQPAKVEAVTDF